MTTATHVAHLLPAFVTGTLVPNDDRDVRAHLQHCAACQAELAAWEAIGQITRTRYGAAATGSLPNQSRAMLPASDDVVSFPVRSLVSVREATDVAACPALPARIVRWSGVMLATAALVLLTLVSALVIGGLHFAASGRDPQLLSLVAPEVLEAEDSVDPATMQGALTTVTVPSLPPDADVIEIGRWTFPATTAPITTLPSTGPVLLYVTQGSLTVSIDGAGAILSGPAGTPVPVTLPMEQQIHASQTLVIPQDARVTLANPSTTAAVVIAVEILEGNAGDWVVPWNQEGIVAERLVSGTANFPLGPATLTLSRQTLATGETLPAPPPGTYQLVAAESKYLGYLARPADGSVINREPDALSVLILTASSP